MNEILNLPTLPQNYNCPIFERTESYARDITFFIHCHSGLFSVYTKWNSLSNSGAREKNVICENIRTKAWHGAQEEAHRLEIEGSFFTLGRWTNSFFAWLLLRFFFDPKASCMPPLASKLMFIPLAACILLLQVFSLTYHWICIFTSYTPVEKCLPTKIVILPLHEIVRPFFLQYP